MANERHVRAIYDRALAKPASLKFRDLCVLAKGAGFRLDRVSGSHHIFLHPNPKCLLNIQDVRGQAKPYQVRQLLKMIEEFQLLG